MSEVHSTPPNRPAKPYPDFPLFLHASGQWAKKIRGQLHYFGKDADAALAKYLEQKDALHAGRTPRPDPVAVTIKDAANAFLNHKQALLDAGELSPRSWVDYKEVAELLVSHFGKQRLVSDLGPGGFAALRKKMAARWGPVRLGKVIQRVRGVFKHAFDTDLIDRPLRFGPGFQPPSMKTLRLHRAQQGKELFTREEIHTLLGAAGLQLRAMILLGINCGLGNSDCGNLPLTALDLDGAMIDYPRPKTGLQRRCPLWPETVAALREALAKRPAPKDAADSGLVFLTQFGLPWGKQKVEDPINKEVGKLLRRIGINGRKGLGFYTLRHTFRTVADEAKDQPAADLIMGHEVPHMSSVYRETISDARLRAITDHVRAWLFPTSRPDQGGEEE
jgi:integrase